MRIRRIWTYRQTVWVAAVLAAALGVFPASGARAATIDFEDLPPNTTVTTQYGGLGVIFPRGARIWPQEVGCTAIFPMCRDARSGQQSLISTDFGVEFDPLPHVIAFTSPQRTVSFFGSCVFAPGDGTVTAFDEQGNVVATDGPKPVPCTFETFFSVTDPAASIRRVEFFLPVSGFELIDDLTFEGAPPPSIAPPPVVQITAPTGGTVDLVTGMVQITGTVSGPSLFGAVLRVMETRPPGSTAPPIVVPLTLVPTGVPDVFSFTATLGPGIPMGRTIILVEATNLSGEVGTAFVEVFNVLPEVAEQCGPGQPLGDLLFSTAPGPCQVAVCGLGAVSVSSAVTRLMPPSILQKWLSVSDPRLGGGGGLGCPVSDAQDTIGGAQRQDFERGRVVDLRTGPGAVFYMARVIAEALDGLGGDEATGLPVSDPLENPTGAFPTWYFQRFHRPEAPAGTLDSTLEIRGFAPVLSVERPGGDLSEFRLAELTLSASTPTVWQTFPCTRQGAAFACTVVPPSSGPPLANANPEFCGTPVLPQLPRQFPYVPRQWVAVRGEYENTAIVGWIRAHSPDCARCTGSHMAGSDNPLVHTCRPVIDPSFDYPRTGTSTSSPCARSGTSSGATSPPRTSRSRSRSASSSTSSSRQSVSVSSTQVICSSRTGAGSWTAAIRMGTPRSIRHPCLSS
jgi:hypothetical protein